LAKTKLTCQKRNSGKKRGELLAAMRRFGDENFLIYDLFYGYKEHPPTTFFYILGTLHRTVDDFVTKEFLSHFDAITFNKFLLFCDLISYFWCT
jgi:hypothetical protein